MKVSFDNLPELRARHRDSVLAYTMGCFDVLHTGHLVILGALARAGDVSVVGITPDNRVKARKGPARPVQQRETRLAVVDSLRGIDYTLLTPGSPPAGYRFVGHAVLRALHPDILLTGDSAWESDREWVEAQGTEIRYVPRKPGSPSTTQTLEGYLDRLRQASEYHLGEG